MTKMVRFLLGAVLTLAGIALLIYVLHQPGHSDVEHKGEGIHLWGLNLNDLVSLLGGIVGVVSGVVTLVSGRPKAGPAVKGSTSRRHR
jgi:hypothetical protein